MGSNPQLQALLQNPGFLSFLKQKLGGQGGAPPPGGMSPVGPGGTAPFQQSGQGGPPPPGGPLPTGQPPSQAMPPQTGSAPPPGSSPSPYKIQNDPSSGVGNLQKPVEQPMTRLPQWQGGPIAGFLQLLTSFYNKKQESQHAEAANAAQSLMQAIEGAKQSGDWTPVYVIMHNNEKLFNKVYKGWLQKSEMQEQAKQKKPEKVDPEVQGVEQGIQKYMAQKGGGPPSSTGASPQGQQPAQGQAPQGPPPPQGMPPGAPPPGSPQQVPRSMGGYQMPQASPEQKLAQQGSSAELQARQQDPGRALQGKLSSGEERQVELTKTGMATTPATQAKLSEIQIKAEAEIKKSYSDVQEAKYRADKADLEYRTAQQRSLIQGQRDETALKKLEYDNKRAQTELDIAKQRLQTEMQKRKGLQTINQSYKMKWGMLNQVEEALKNMIVNKQPIDGKSVAGIVNLLKNAGATGIANDLVKQQSTWYKSYATPQDILDQLQEYKTGFQKAFNLDKNGIATEGGATSSTEAKPGDASGPAEGETDDEATPEEGDEVPYKGFIYRYDGKQYVKTDKKAPN
jgi:hypothetical protein